MASTTKSVVQPFLAISRATGRGILKWHVWPGEDDAATIRRIITDATDALLGPGPGCFPGRLWTKAEQSPRWLAILEMIGVFSGSYLEFLSLLGDIDM